MTLSIGILIPLNTSRFPCVLSRVTLRGAAMTMVLDSGMCRYRARRTLLAFGGTLTMRQLSLF